MSHQIALNFDDGVSRFLVCGADETVLDAAYRHKINLPMDCSDGVCGTCKCRCDSGTYLLGDEYLDEALSADEAAEGFVLTCQMRPTSDCVVAVPIPSTACRVKPAEFNASVTAIEQVSDSTIVLRLAPEDPAALHHLPGQYINLRVPGTDQHRAYSFSSKPGAPVASFLIRNIPEGLMSRWLTDSARIGDRMTFVGPYGSFFLRPVERTLLMLAGGTGLAPLLSMLEVLADRRCEQSIHLIYGVTNDTDLVELDRLSTLAARLPQFSWTTCVADEASAHTLKGYVTDHLTDHHLSAGECDIYLCGPPAMVEAVRTFLRNKNVVPAHFHYEKFAPSEATVT